jgi:cation diffusion facilitator family transporter
VERATSIIDGSSGAQQRTAAVSLAAAFVLVALKLGTGLATGSLALVSAGVESSGDVIAALLTIGAIRIAGRPADREHNYGHRRSENIAALGEAGIVFVGGCIIAFEAVRQLVHGTSGLHASWYLFAVIGVALCIDVTRIAVSLRAAKRYDSAAFRSNAFNFSSDLAGSLAVLAGLVLVAAGVPAGDAIAALVVAVVIFAAVGRLAFENVRALMDYAPPGSRTAIARAIAEAEPSAQLRRLRVRDVAGRIYADVTLGVPPASATSASHHIADRVEDAVQRAAPGSDVVVHTEPAMTGADLRERILATALADPSVRDVHDVSIYVDAAGRHVVALHLKLDGDATLQEAHDAAERVEAAISSLDPRVTAVQSHLEPLETPVTDTTESSDEDLARIVAELLGHPALDVQARNTEAGPVAFLTIAVDPDTDLAASHGLASQLEHDLRLKRPDLADVIVHTEPS